MPSVAALTASILYAALAWYVSGLVPPLFEGQRIFPTLAIWNAAFALILGWQIAGSRAGQGMSGAIGYGITTIVALFLTALFLHSAAEMIDRSMRRLYDGPAEAVIGIFNLMYEFGQRIATVEIVASCLIGRILAALLVDSVGRRFD